MKCPNCNHEISTQDMLSELRPDGQLIYFPVRLQDGRVVVLPENCINPKTMEITPVSALGPSVRGGC